MIPGYARWGFTVFFSTHFFISLLLDVQALKIGDNFPELLKSLMQVSMCMDCLVTAAKSAYHLVCCLQIEEDNHAGKQVSRLSSLCVLTDPGSPRRHE